VSETASLDYHVGFSCPIKRRFSLDQLAPVVLAEGGVEAVRTRYRPPLSEEDPPPPLTRTHPGPAGRREVPPAEVARLAEALARFTRSCRDCPANLGGSRAGYGCVGTVDLPLPEEAERCLMAVIERIMEGGGEADAGADLPIRFIWDNGVPGEAIAALRAEEGWLKLDEAVVSRVGPFLEKRPVSSDQVLEVFLGAPRFGLEYAVMFGPFLAAFPRLAASLGEEAEPAAPFVHLFDALHLAGELGVDTHLTPLKAAPDEETEEA